MTAPARCEAAHADDPSPCDGPVNLVRILSANGDQTLGCLRHGAVLLASLESGIVRQGPAGVPNAAITVHMRARGLKPFAFGTAGGPYPQQPDPSLTALTSAPDPDDPPAPPVTAVMINDLWREGMALGWMTAMTVITEAHGKHAAAGRVAAANALHDLWLQLDEQRRRMFG